MQIAVTFRHMETSAPVRTYVEEKLSRVKKYIDEPIDAQVVLSVEKKIRHSAEIALVAKGITIKGADQTNDMYAAIDSVVDKIERQLKRYKEKIKNRITSYNVCYTKLLRKGFCRYYAPHVWPGHHTNVPCNNPSH